LLLQGAVSDALKATGVDLNAVGSTTSTIVKTVSTSATAATPYVDRFVAFVSTKDPVTLLEYGVGALAVVYLLPGLLGAAFGSLRGYAGELNAAAALDFINNEGAFLVDIRGSKEKEAGGLPDVAGGARDRLFEVEYAFTEDRRLRGQIRDASGLEAQVGAACRDSGRIVCHCYHALGVGGLQLVRATSATLQAQGVLPVLCSRSQYAGER